MDRKKGVFAAIKIVLILCRLLAVVVIAAALLFAYLTIAEYRPSETETVAVLAGASPSSEAPLPSETDMAGSLADPAGNAGTIFKAVSWNIGYGALGDNAEFFMDGGSDVKTASRERVTENMKQISIALADEDADFIFLQETDRDSARSYHFDEAAMLQDAFPEYNSAFAYNFKVPFVPYPVPPIGKVESGLLTMSRFGMADAQRIQLPVPFSWPVRTANLKRCLLITRIPLTEASKDSPELVLVNLHLEAYDSGEGKIAQTNMLRDLLMTEAKAGNYVIAGGDFNQIFSNVDSPYPLYENRWLPGQIETETFDDGFSCLMDSGAASCRSLDQPLEGADPGQFQFYIIDGFIVSDNITVNSLKTIDLGFRNSDHNPVELIFTLP